MADSMDPTGLGSLFSPVIKEIQKGNALNRDLLKEERDNDTPKSLLAGNIFEILNAKQIQKKLFNY